MKELLNARWDQHTEGSDTQPYMTYLLTDVEADDLRLDWHSPSERFRLIAEGDTESGVHVTVGLDLTSRALQQLRDLVE
jgi:hypothetical protein